MNLNRRARLFFVWASLLTGLTCTQNLMAASCSISSLGSLTNLSYDPMNGSPTLSAITFNITCSGGGGGTIATVRSIALSIGQSTTATNFTTRIMKLNDNLSYQLYQDSQRTVVWGDGTGGSFANTATYTFTNGQTRNFTIYVKIPAQNIYSGTYTVTPGPQITITW